ncbi:hypothetical protein IFT56_21670 [Rhizobium sp. CFBP 13717]|nr:hypothetical protein [Rhizobium sp. CFBP 13717]
MKVLLQSLHPCAYFQQTTFIGQVCAAFFKVVVSQSGYGFEYCKDETYANDVPARPDGYRGYVEAYRDYEIRAQDYQRKVHIAVITHPEYRSLMKIADISIVLCTLPPDDDKYKQIHLPHDVPAWAVFYKVHEMVAEARAEVKAEAGDALENLKKGLKEFLPFMQLKGKDEDVKEKIEQ